MVFEYMKNFLQDHQGYILLLSGSYYKYEALFNITMRIRLEEDGVDKFKVILPGQNKDFPIGIVWKDLFKGKIWKIKCYFPIYGLDSYVEKKTYDDFMKAARVLASTFKYNNPTNSCNLEEQENTYDFSWSDATD